MIFLMEAYMIVEAIENMKLLSNVASASESYPRRYAKALHGFIGSIKQKCERTISHSTIINKRSVQMFEVKYTGTRIQK